MEIAKLNAELNGVQNIYFLKSNLLSDLPQLDDTYTLVANLPYVPAEDKVAEIEYNTKHEPDEAIYSGADGLDHFRALVLQLLGMRKPEAMYFELDPRNIREARLILTEFEYKNLKILPDENGLERFIACY